MTIQSGKITSINGVSTAQSWAVNFTSDPRPFGASNTLGGTGRRRGNMDWNGSIVQWAALPIFMPNEYFDFSGYTGEDSGALSGTRYYGNVIVDSANIVWNWASGDIIKSTINFSGNGKWQSEVPGTAPVDATQPDPVSVIQTKVQAGVNIAGLADWDDLTQANLTLTAATQSYVNSSTIETVNSKVYAFAKRRPGKLDWTLALTEQNSAGLAAARFLQEDVVLRLFVDDTDYWELAWGHVGESTGITADNDTGAIIERTVNISMNAAPTGESQVGRILKPGGALYYGVPAA